MKTICTYEGQNKWNFSRGNIVYEEGKQVIDELKKIVKNSDEEEVKSLLYHMFLHIHRAEEIEQYSEKQTVLDLKRIYHDFLNYKQNQSIRRDTQYKIVHLVFGDSPAGGLKLALKEMGVQDEEKVVPFSDIFSVGPVWRLHEKEGLSNRYEWLKNHINMDDEVLDYYQESFNQTLIELNDIPLDAPIIIWVGENAHEQTALRYVLNQLKNKPNDFFIMNTTTEYKSLFNIPDRDFSPLHTGEISHDQMRIIYEKSRTQNAVTPKERQRLEKEWEQLSSKQEVLRVWKNHEIHSVDESYFDDYLVDTVRKIHTKRKNHDFIKSARLIGEAMGHIPQYIGDQFLEYRVRHLIVNGQFEIKGVPKAMRYYSVRLL